MGQANSPTNGSAVLVALDLSERSEQCLSYGCDIAAKFRQPMIVLHVAHETGATEGMYRRHNQSRDTTPIRDIARTMLEERIAAFREKYDSLERVCDVRLVVVEGVPETRILEIADLYDAGMIVMCSQKRSGLNQFLHGSVTEFVLKRASRPVVVTALGGNVRPSTGIHHKPLDAGSTATVATGA